jgi:hypothetical protein
VFLGADGRTALADYLEHERPVDAGPATDALLLSAASIGSRRPDGRLSPRSINLICEQIGRWHDAEHGRLGPAHQPATAPRPSAQLCLRARRRDRQRRAYELERRLGHQSQRYIHRYTNPPEDIAASYVEQM